MGCDLVPVSSGGRVWLGELEVDCVQGMAARQHLALFGPDDVVGWGDQGVERGFGRGVTGAAEWLERRHGHRLAHRTPVDSRS